MKIGGPAVIWAELTRRFAGRRKALADPEAKAYWKDPMSSYLDPARLGERGLAAYTERGAVAAESRRKGNSRRGAQAARSGISDFMVCSCDRRGKFSP